MNKYHYPVLEANAPFLSIPAALKILMFSVADSEWHMAGCRREENDNITDHSAD